jgi:SAM-dependent methyltransferase
MTTFDPARRFPRSTTYNPEWLRAHVSGAANALWLTEWLTEALALEPGQRVLDLGCGRACSSVFLRRELGVEVWAADLWFDPSENLERLHDAGVADGVFPLRVDARALPFAEGFFDAIVSVDSFVYYGTDDLFLGNLARFVKPGGAIAIAGAGLVHELDGPVPTALRAWWEPSLACLHSAAWWRRHWERSGVVEVERADTLEDGWRYWLAWQQQVCPDNRVEIEALEADQGQTLGYVRALCRRKHDLALEAPITSLPRHYERQALLRDR